ncbi:MAG: hypothetical protein ACI8XM_001902 [Haloarculaceae archaeon]|jgi:hypothetical protein
MASHTAIADIGDTLVTLLRDRMGDPIDDEDIVLASPGDEGVGQDLRLTVYLYDVRQNEHLSNDRSRPERAGRPAGASLVLDLHYLLTALPKESQSNAKQTTQTRDQHEVLGRAMQVLAENQIVRNPDLGEQLDSEDVVQITFESTERRELLDVWGTFDETPYHPSVPFAVSPVVIESERDAESTRVLASDFEQYTVRGFEEGGGT